MGKKKAKRKRPPVWSSPPPTRVVIAGRYYEIRVVPAADISGKFGETRHLTGVIRLSADMNEDLAQSTLLHELLHVAVFVGGGESILHLARKSPPDVVHELLVCAIEPGLLQILKDNPYLTTWLTSRSER